MTTADCLLLTAHHHSDLVWRRTRSGYGDVREAQILQAFDYLRRYPEFCFTFAQTEAVKDYLQRHPEHAEEFAGYVRSGRIEIQGGCVGISDVNIPCGEALLRNMVIGRRWLRDTFGIRPRMAWFMDDFGMNGQLPQLCRHAGFTAMLPGRQPTLAPEVTGGACRWQGIDGTVIPSFASDGGLQAGTHVCNLPVSERPEQRLRTSLVELWDRADAHWGLMCTEEDLFEDVVFDYIAELAAEPGRRPLRWATPSQYLATVDPTALPLHRGELNPEFTGCYTSHIRLKLLNRRAEAALHAAEAAGVAARVATGAPWPRADINALWELLALCQFHDGICGCHVDAVNDEMTDWFQRIIAESGAVGRAAIERSAATAEPATIIFNPNLGDRYSAVRTRTPLVDANGAAIPGQQDGDHVISHVELPSVGSARFTAGTAAAPGKVIHNPTDLTLEVGDYDLRIEAGKLRIVPKFAPADILPGDFGAIRCREDGGNMWTEEYLGPVLSTEYNVERIERVVHGPVFTRVRVAGKVVPPPNGLERSSIWPGFDRLNWHKEFTFYAGQTHFDVDVELEWYGSRTEVMIEFPVGVDANRARGLYEVPFGTIERQPYYEVTKENAATCRRFQRNELARAKGNWPALGWVDYADDHGGLTVANAGTPGHRCQNGAITVSLLRSPTTMSSHFLPGATALDNGRRQYRFACWPHEGAPNFESLGIGQEHSHRPIVTEGCTAAATGSLVATDARNLVLSALKCAEDGDDVVVRLYEALGEATDTTLAVGFDYTEAWLADANEEPLERLNSLALAWRPYEIKTILFKR